MANLIKDNQLADPIKLGGIEGYVISYSTTTAVAISLGSVEANGKFYNLSADTTHSLTGLVNGFDIQYIYIDDSANTEPTAVFINSLTEPTFDAAKRGWYNGNNRMIGKVNIGTGIATIIPFETTIINNKLIRATCGQNVDAQNTLATGQNPTGAFAVPNVRESNVTVGVSAVEIRVKMFNTDAASVGALGASSLEYSVLESATFDAIVNYEWSVRGDLTQWMPLGISRNIRIFGADNDDNIMRVFNAGEGYER